MFYSHQKKTLSPSIYSHQNNFHFLSAGTRSAWCWCWPPPPCPLLSSPLSLILHHQRQLHFIGLPLCLKDLLGLNTKSNITHFTCYHSSPLLNSLQSKYSVVKHFPFLVSVFLSHFIIRHILFDIFRGSHVFFLAGHLKAIYLIDQPLIQQLLFVDFLISQNLRETPEIFIISSLIFILSSLFSANIVHLRISYLYLLFLHCSHLLEFSSLSLAWRHFPSVWQNFPPLWYHFYCLNISYHLNNCLRWSKCKEPTKTDNMFPNSEVSTTTKPSEWTKEKSSRPLPCLIQNVFIIFIANVFSKLGWMFQSSFTNFFSAIICQFSIKLFWAALTTFVAAFIWKFHML